MYIYIYKCRNVANLATVEPYSHDVSCISNLSGVLQQHCLGHSSNHDLNKTNSVSPNIVNLSRRNLTSNGSLTKGERNAVYSLKNDNYNYKRG